MLCRKKLCEWQQGWPHWKTPLFMNFVADGTFDVAYTTKDAERESKFRKHLKDTKIKQLKEQEQRTGVCNGCNMALHVCLCSHEG